MCVELINGCFVCIVELMLVATFLCIMIEEGLFGHLEDVGEFLVRVFHFAILTHSPYLFGRTNQRIEFCCGDFTNVDDELGNGHTTCLFLLNGDRRRDFVLAIVTTCVVAKDYGIIGCAKSVNGFCLRFSEFAVCANKDANSSFRYYGKFVPCKMAMHDFDWGQLGYGEIGTELSDDVDVDWAKASSSQFEQGTIHFTLYELCITLVVDNGELYCQSGHIVC